MADVLSLEKARKRKRFFRRILWLCFLAVLLVGVLLIYLYRDTLRNFELADYLQQEESDSFPITLPTSNHYDLRHTRNKLLLLSDTHLTIYNAAGSQLASFQHGMGSPSMALSDTRCVLYERGAKKLIIIPMNTLKADTLEMEYPLISACCSDRGQLCVVLSGTRYVSELVVYNERQTELYRWQTQKQVTATVFSGENRLAAITLNTLAGALESQLHIIPLDREEFIGVQYFQENLLLSLDCKSNGNFIAVGDRETVCVSPEGKLIRSVAYGSEGISYFHNEDDTIVLVLGDCVTYKSNETLVLDQELNQLGRYNSTDKLISLIGGSDTAVLLFDGHAIRFRDGRFSKLDTGYGPLEVELFADELILRTVEQLTVYREAVQPA